MVSFRILALPIKSATYKIPVCLFQLRCQLGLATLGRSRSPTAVASWLPEAHEAGHSLQMVLCRGPRPSAWRRLGRPRPARDRPHAANRNTPARRLRKYTSGSCEPLQVSWHAQEHEACLGSRLDRRLSEISAFRPTGLSKLSRDGADIGASVLSQGLSLLLDRTRLVESARA